MTTSNKRLYAPKHLPDIGGHLVIEAPDEPGHYLWLSLLGWHDCLPSEDAAIKNAINDTINQGAQR